MRGSYNYSLDDSDSVKMVQSFLAPVAERTQTCENPTDKVSRAFESRVVVRGQTSRAANSTLDPAIVSNA